MSGLGVKNFTQEQDNYIIKQYRYGKSANKIARDMLVYPQRITNCLRRHNIKPVIFYPGARGEQNGRWKGGRRMIKGYIHLLKPGHHLARKDGYVAEHRLIMEKVLGRELFKKEVVNHIDGNPLNNSIKNLEVFDNNGKHMAMHAPSFKRDIYGRFES